MNKTKIYKGLELIDNKEDSKKVFIIAPGASGGMSNDFIKNISSKLNKNNYSTIRFNFSFQTNKNEASKSGDAEFSDIEKVYEYTKDNYPNSEIHLIGKSLGGIMCSWLAKKYPEDINSVCILGYIPKYIDFGNFDKYLLIIQGKKDKFGDTEIIKNNLDKIKTENTIISISNADHSYRLKNGSYKTEEVIENIINYYNS